MNLKKYIVLFLVCAISLSGFTQVIYIADTSRHGLSLQDTSKHIVARDTSKPIIVIAPVPPAPDSGIHVYAPALVRNTIQKVYDYQRYSHCSSPGYRVQIDFSQERSSVSNTKSNFTLKYPGMSSYLTYKQPYFRVSVGDFRDRLSAERFLHTVKKDYPAAFVVADKITLPPIQ